MKNHFQTCQNANHNKHFQKEISEEDEYGLKVDKRKEKKKFLKSRF